MRIQQRNIEKIYRKLNAFAKRQTGIHEQRIRFSVCPKRIVKKGMEFIEEDFIGQNTPLNMPFCPNQDD